MNTPEDRPAHDGDLPDDDRPSDYTQRRFRRYHAAQARRRKASAADDRFSRAVFSVAGIAAALAIGLGVLGMRGLSIDPESAARLTSPWIGPASRIEVYGIGFIVVLAVIFMWRVRRR